MNKKLIATSLGMAVLLCNSVYAMPTTSRWYSGYESTAGSYNYYGAHSTLKTPVSVVSIDTSTSYSMSTNFVNMDIPDGTSTDWLQIGYTHGYDALYKYHSGYTSFVEYGWVNYDGTITAHESMENDQPLNTAWDYWVRWDTPSNSWKVNINNLYTDYFYAGGTNRGRIEADGEVNMVANHNGGTYTTNTFYDGGSTWYNFDSTFKPRADSGSYVSGTPTNYTVSR